MNEGVKISDAAIGSALAGLFGFLILLGACLFAIRSFKRWRRRRLALKGNRSNGKFIDKDPNDRPLCMGLMDIL